MRRSCDSVLDLAREELGEAFAVLGDIERVIKEGKDYPMGDDSGYIAALWYKAHLMGRFLCGLVNLVLAQNEQPAKPGKYQAGTYEKQDFVLQAKEVKRQVECLWGEFFRVTSKLGELGILVEVKDSEGKSGLDLSLN